jgi:hypothetical protein
LDAQFYQVIANFRIPLLSVGNTKPSHKQIIPFVTFVEEGPARRRHTMPSHVIEGNDDQLFLDILHFLQFRLTAFKERHAPAPSNSPDLLPGLVGRFYRIDPAVNPPVVFGEHLFTETFRLVNFSWTHEPLRQNISDFFAARFSGWLCPATSQGYLFRSQSDDGVRLWVDNALLIDFWRGSAAENFTVPAPLFLQQGCCYPLKIEWYNYRHHHGLRLFWSTKPQGDFQLVGPANFFHSKLEETSEIEGIDAVSEGHEVPSQ